MEEKVLDAAMAGLLYDVNRTAQKAGLTNWKPLNADRAPQPLIELAELLCNGELPGEQYSRQLVTIFDRLQLDEKVMLPRDDQLGYRPLQPMSLKKEVLFPGKLLDETSQKKALTQIFQEIHDTLQTSTADSETQLEQFLADLHRLAWCLPYPSRNTMADVSLYDHARITASLAVCLSEFPLQKITENLQIVRDNFAGKAAAAQQKVMKEPAAMLLGGDISGIQAFIYTLSARGAARTLRGRSFYLQLLTEALLRYVLRELGLPYTNVIYTGGGHFYLLAPLSSREKLPDLRRRISQILVRAHGTQLYLALGGVEIPFDGFRPGEFPGYWDEMHRSLTRIKQQRYAELGDELYGEVFAPRKHGGNQDKTCSVCGEENEEVKQLEDETDTVDQQTLKICPMCASFKELVGRDLVYAAFVELFLGSPSDLPPDDVDGVLANLGMGVRFSHGVDETVKRPELIQAERAVIWALDDPENGKWLTENRVPAVHWLRYTVNRVPRDEKGRVKTFDQLGKSSKQNGQANEVRGIDRLGVLRMDVDSLGQLFKDGLNSGGEKRASLARISALSMQMSLFFEGWVKQLCQEKEDAYAVYAGGDDVFLIAPWQTVPELARQIADDLQIYSHNNLDVHVSGGMSFIHGKYPVYQAAEDAAAALEKAKRENGKNAFTFLDQAWKWAEFKHVEENRERLRKIETEMEGARSLLQLLQQLALQRQSAVSERGLPVYGPWLWRGSYYLKRRAEQVRKSKPQLADELEGICKDLEPFYEHIATWGAAARWVQLAIRERVKKAESKNQEH